MELGISTLGRIKVAEINEVGHKSAWKKWGLVKRN